MICARSKNFVRHKAVTTTMIYTQVLNRGGRGVCSPAAQLERRTDHERSPASRANLGLYRAGPRSGYAAG